VVAEKATEMRTTKEVVVAKTT
jgi:hypothetical protein